MRITVSLSEIIGLGLVTLVVIGFLIALAIENIQAMCRRRAERRSKH